jgi:hypothetical protein
MLSQWIGKLTGEEWGLGVFLALTILAIVAGTVIALFHIAASESRKVRVAQLEVALKQEMVQRGMSADEIAKVLAASTVHSATQGDEGGDNPDRYAQLGPATCDITAQDDDGEWHQAVLLGMREHECFVHYIGTYDDDPRWIPRTRVRFPAAVAFEEAARGDWPDDYNAQQATVERDGEWLPAYVLMHLDQCYVHYIGTDASENEWVPEDRVRFADRPAFGSGTAHSRRPGPLAPGKPEPVAAEV